MCVGWGVLRQEPHCSAGDAVPRALSAQMQCHASALTEKGKFCLRGLLSEYLGGHHLLGQLFVLEVLVLLPKIPKLGSPYYFYQLFHNLNVSLLSHGTYPCLIFNLPQKANSFSPTCYFKKKESKKISFLLRLAHPRADK